MAFYNEIFIEENNVLKHVGSCTGSDTPCYFDKVNKLNDFNEQLIKLEKENGFYKHGDKHPFPWKTYKTSDNLIVLRENKRLWFQFWKPTHVILVSADKYSVKDDNKCKFIAISRFFGDIEYDEADLITLELPLFNK